MSDPFGPSQSVANFVTTRPVDSRSFGSLDTFLQDCVNGVGGTPLTAEMFNEWIANMRALVRANGNLIGGSPVVAEDHTDTMLLRGVQQLVQRGQPLVANDVGAANAIVINPVPALEEYKRGVRHAVYLANAITGPSTINVSGNGLRALTRADLSPTQAGDGLAGEMLEVIDDGVQYQIAGLTSGAPSIPGRTAIITASRSFIVPATQLEVEIFGGGGAGGASADGSSGSQAGNGGGGGHGGGYGYKRISGLVIGASIAVTIGAAGVALASSNGGDGGTSSFGSYVSATGGAGGLWGTGTLANRGGPGAGVGADLSAGGGFGGPTGPNTSSYVPNSSYSVLSRGGIGAGGLGGLHLFGSGQLGIGFASGGGGATGGSGLAGGNGAPGLVIVRW